MKKLNHIIMSFITLSLLMPSTALGDEKNNIVFEFLLKINKNICKYIKLPDYHECDFNPKKQKVTIHPSKIITGEGIRFGSKEHRIWVNSCGAAYTPPGKKCIVVGNMMHIVDQDFQPNTSPDEDYNIPWQKSCHAIEAKNFRCLTFNSDELRKQLHNARKENRDLKVFERRADSTLNLETKNSVQFEYFQERNQLIKALDRANRNIDDNQKNQKSLKWEHLGDWIIFVQEKKVERIIDVSKAAAKKDMIGAAVAVVGNVGIVEDMIKKSEEHKIEREQLKKEHQEYKNDIEDLKDQIYQNEKTIERMQKIPAEHKPNLGDKIKKSG